MSRHCLITPVLSGIENGGVADKTVPPGIEPFPSWLCFAGLQYVDGLGELSGTARTAWRSFGARGVALIGFTLYGPGDPPGLRRSEGVRTDPSRTRAGAAGRARRSGARAGTASGAVCAGSNPAGGAGRKH